MRHTFFRAAVLVALVASPVMGQATTHDHQKSAAPADARFEILESLFGARYTFRLDKVTGDTWQMVMQPDSTITWHFLTKLDHPLADTKIPNRVNYQMFLSGLGVRYTFLINVNTGATWQLTEDQERQVVWTAFP